MRPYGPDKSSDVECMTAGKRAVYAGAHGWGHTLRQRHSSSQPDGSGSFAKNTNKPARRSAVKNGNSAWAVK